MWIKSDLRNNEAKFEENRGVESLNSSSGVGLDINHERNRRNKTSTGHLFMFFLKQHD